MLAVFSIVWEDSQTPFRIWERLWIPSSEKITYACMWISTVDDGLSLDSPRISSKARLWGYAVYVHRRRESIEVDMGESRQAINDGKQFPQRWLKPMELVIKIVQNIHLSIIPAKDLSTYQILVMAALSRTWIHRCFYQQCAGQGGFWQPKGSPMTKMQVLAMDSQGGNGKTIGEWVDRVSYRYTSGFPIHLIS